MKIRLSILTLVTLTMTACSTDTPEQPTPPSEQNRAIQTDDAQNNLAKDSDTTGNLIQANHTQSESTKNISNVIMGGTYHSLNTDDSYPNLICINYDKHIEEAMLIGFDEDDVSYALKFLTLPVMQDRQLLEKCNAEATLTESHYIAYLPEGSKFSGYGQAFDADDANSIDKDGQIIGLDFDKDGQPDYLTTCSSMEGEHLNAWHDDTRSKKLAYAYRYINADLISTCEEIDYEDDYL